MIDDTDPSDDTDATDNEVFLDLEAALVDYPKLRGLLPTGFPRARKFGISRRAMQEYSDTRKEKFWHQLNLPLLLHAYRRSKDAKVSALMRSILVTLEDFISRLGGLPGARSLLAPLWNDLWTTTPQLWSIVGCAYLALCYQTNKIEVLGFESSIGGSAKDDITLRLDGRLTHVEVEAHHRAVFADKTDAQLEDALRQRADAKAAKFRGLPKEETGVVAIVCVVTGVDLERRPHLAVKPLPDRPENIKWMATRLVGVAHPDGLRFAIKSL